MLHVAVVSDKPPPSARTTGCRRYCGSGIAATYLAFQLARLGRDDVAVYDGSLTEWAADELLPLETGTPAA